MRPGWRKCLGKIRQGHFEELLRAVALAVSLTRARAAKMDAKETKANRVRGSTWKDGKNERKRNG